MISTRDDPVVGLGEALFDCFGERRVLGGAPVNFAVHAQALLRPAGGAAAIASRVGDDELGARLVESVGRRGIETACIQTDDALPTGVVTVSTTNGEPSYAIARPAAWDALEFDDALRSLALRCRAVCFGTLARRDPRSCHAVSAFLETTRARIRLLDLNLRGPHTPPELVEGGLALANALKINEAELATLKERFELPSDPDDAIDVLRRTFALEFVALTRGARGTVLYIDGARIEHEPTPCVRVAHADSVGAGDASAAALVCALLEGLAPAAALDLANRVGAFVAGQPGGSPELPDALVGCIVRSGARRVATRVLHGPRPAASG